MSDLRCRPLGAFGVEVLDVDLRDELDEKLQEELREAWQRDALLLFRGQQNPSGDDLERTANIFGQVSKEGVYGARPFVSNIDPEGLTPTGALPFHTDKCFTDRPLRGLILAAYEVPPPSAGGDTLFANVALAYDYLPPELREKVDRLQISHVGSDRTTHPMAYKHPVTGKTVLFYSTWFFDRIPGMGPEETEAFRKVLDTYVDSPRTVYRHQWQAGDVVVWDNITLQHSRADFDPTKRRHLRRIQIIAKDEIPGTSGEAASKIAKEERRVGQQ